MRLLAKTPEEVFGTVTPPDSVKAIGSGATGLGNFLTTIIEVLYVVAGIAFIFMFVLGAFQWLTSGGDKEAIGKARGRITNAIIGLILLAVAFVFIRAFGQFTGFSLFQGQQ